MKSTPESSLSGDLAQRKGAHIELASHAQTSSLEADHRFNYEPLFFTHPKTTASWPIKFLKHELSYPVWISSMTGGTSHARTINENLARLCGEHKLGMGLGSCRSLLEGNERFEDFNVRRFIGDQPLFANLGLAQLEQILDAGKTHLIHEMIKKIEATGLIIHLNPLQEWFQPEGDRYQKSPLHILQNFLPMANYPVIVKEVGQGMGPKSLEALLQLPIAAIEFGAFGGTNFSLLENLRKDGGDLKRPFIKVGHTASEMVEFINGLSVQDKEFIISGGIRNVLDGYELITRCKGHSVMGLANAFLAPALESYESVSNYFNSFRESLLTAKGILNIRGKK